MIFLNQSKDIKKKGVFFPIIKWTFLSIFLIVFLSIFSVFNIALDNHENNYEKVHGNEQKKIDYTNNLTKVIFSFSPIVHFVFYKENLPIAINSYNCLTNGESCRQSEISYDNISQVIKSLFMVSILLLVKIHFIVKFIFLIKKEFVKVKDEHKK